MPVVNTSSGTLEVRLEPTDTITVEGITGSVAVYYDRGNPSITVDNAITLGQDNMAASVPVTMANNQSTMTVTFDPGYTIGAVNQADAPWQVQSNSANIATQTTLASVLSALQIIDDWDDNDAANTFPKPYAERYAINTGDADVAYHGWAAVGALTSNSVWRIRRITSNAVTSGDATIEWADGDSSFDNEWDNIESLSYS